MTRYLHTLVLLLAVLVLPSSCIKEDYVPPQCGTALNLFRYSKQNQSIMTRYLHTLVLLLAVLVLPSSCIKEDYDDCDNVVIYFQYLADGKTNVLNDYITKVDLYVFDGGGHIMGVGHYSEDDCDNVVIYFQYLADGKTNVLNDYITKVDLYVFDGGGHIMGVGHYSEDELKHYAAIPSFRLTPGEKYRVVAVGNAFNRTEVENLTSETDFNKIFIQHPAWGSGEGKVDGHDHNYLGQLDFTMPGYAAIPSFRLTPGEKYRVVAVGNAFNRTEVENLTSETDFNKIFIQHPAWGSGEGKVDGHDHNYLGQLDFTMPGGENFTVYRDTVTLLSAHINVDIEINGLPAPDALGEGGEIPYELRIEESNAQTDFNGDVNMEEKGTCYPALSTEMLIWRRRVPATRL